MVLLLEKRVYFGGKTVQAQRADTLIKKMKITIPSSFCNSRLVQNQLSTEIAGE
jgi:hypothetical protein